MHACTVADFLKLACTRHAVMSWDNVIIFNLIILRIVLYLPVKRNNNEYKTDTQRRYLRNTAFAYD